MEGNSRPGVWREGAKYGGPVVDFAGRVKKSPLPCGKAASAKDLEGEYAFFTPAVLYLLGVIDDRPLIDLMCEIGEDVPVFYKKFKHALFGRLVARDGDPSWNYALWAVRRQHWERLLDFYCSMAVFNRRTSQVFRVASQELDVVDPFAVESSPIVSASAGTARVTAFCVSGDKFVANFEPSPSPLMLPRLKFREPLASAAAFNAAVAAGESPHDAEENFLPEGASGEKD